jgi:hypothetical protein
MVRFAQRQDVRFIELTLGMLSNFVRVMEFRRQGYNALRLAVNAQRVARKVRLPKGLPRCAVAARGG